MQQLGHAPQTAWTSQRSKLQVRLATAPDLLHRLRMQRQWQADRRRSTCAKPNKSADPNTMAPG